MEPSKHILVIGSANVDFIMGLSRLPGPGETVTDGTFTQTFGGKGANQAVAAARSVGQNAHVSLLCRVGDDLYGPPILENLTRERIDTTHSQTLEATATGTALILFDAQGENVIGVAPGANGRINPGDIDACEALIRGADLLLLQMEIPEQVVRRVLDIAEREGVGVLLNYAPIRHGQVEVNSAIGGLIVNEQEAAALSNGSLTQRDAATRAGVALHQRGPGFVIVTLGSRGVLIVDGAGPRTLPAVSVKAKDATAAGDTFCGALAGSILEDQPLDQAVKWASAAAGLCVTRVGAQASIPHRHEIVRLLDGA